MAGKKAMAEQKQSSYCSATLFYDTMLIKLDINQKILLYN